MDRDACGEMDGAFRIGRIDITVLIQIRPFPTL